MDHGKMFGHPRWDRVRGDHAPVAPPPAPQLKPLDRLARYFETPRGERVFHRACIVLVLGWAAVVIYGGVTLARAIGEAMR